MSKHIIEQEMIAREWVQKEVINKKLKLFNADSPQPASNFQVIYFGIDNHTNNATLNYVKERDVFFMVGAITYLKVQNVGWFGDLADFVWDKNKNKVEEEFEKLSKEDQEIFLMETSPYFSQTKPWIELEKIYKNPKEKVVADNKEQLSSI